MRKYQLFAEWCGRATIGETLGDALKRNGLKEPDLYEYILVRKGEFLPIKGILVAEKENPGTRGDKKFVTAIVELETGRIVEVDAEFIEEI